MDRLEVLKERWDHLIILDACRYDYFEQVYAQYLQGELTTKLSPGTCTDEWRDKSFPGYYDDIIYISGNPQICATQKVYGYCAGEHFHKVYEIWEDHWDSKMGTVLPDVLRRAAVNIVRETAGHGKRYIIHFLQPHSPYLSIANEEIRRFMQGEVDRLQRVNGTGANTSLEMFKQALVRQLLRFVPRNDVFMSPPDWYLRKLLKMMTINPMEAAWRSVGRKGLRQAYRQNLEAVLKETAILIESLRGRIIVTSDHGELLGERLCYAHPQGSSDPLLVTVPWLTIEKDIAAEPEISEDHGVDSQGDHRGPTEEGEQSKLIEKLNALGYFD